MGRPSLSFICIFSIMFPSIGFAMDDTPSGPKASISVKRSSSGEEEAEEEEIHTKSSEEKEEEPDSRRTFLKATEKKHINGLPTANEILEWWSEHSSNLAQPTQDEFNEEINELGRRHDNGEISDEEFRKLLLEVLTEQDAAPEGEEEEEGPELPYAVNHQKETPDEKEQRKIEVMGAYSYGIKKGQEGGEEREEKSSSSSEHEKDASSHEGEEEEQ
jgi:hypothetical protein